MSQDLSAILEADTLTYIRTAGIFLVFCVALFNFTDTGKAFSIISLLISLVLFVSITVYYFHERNRIFPLGFKPKPLMDVLMFTMIAVIILILWILYTVWNTQPTSLSQIAKEIEEKIDESNKAQIDSLKTNLNAIERNKELISQTPTISSQNLETFKARDDLVSQNIAQRIQSQKGISEATKNFINLGKHTDIKNMGGNAILASIS